MTLKDLFTAVLGGVAGFFIAELFIRLVDKLIYRHKLKRTDKAMRVVPANTRIVTSDGVQYFTTERGIIGGGYLIVQVHKESA